MKNIRALSFNDALEQGLKYKKYDYQNIPEKFTGKLDFKVWGERQTLKLYFSCENGDKFVLSVFSIKKSVEPKI